MKAYECIQEEHTIRYHVARIMYI